MSQNCVSRFTASTGTPVFVDAVLARFRLRDRIRIQPCRCRYGIRAGGMPSRQTLRRHDASGAAVERPTGRGPNGRRRCRWCGNETAPPRRTFCSAACVDEWRIRSSAAYARQRVCERDKGVCALCRVDTTRQLVDIEQQFGRYVSNHGWTRWLPEPTRMDAFCAALAAVSIPYSRWAERGRRAFRGERVGLWDVDHIVPVCEGGGSCGLENLRTLCLACHREQTKLLRARRKQSIDAGG